ncbi:hypothetical protein QQX98_000371 [Neonectria punicea]|uniref:Uncharacterized protein n=1 Tax=Neonectria punicea TaxID=979145 RepID=A0ABR1HVD4_9HYPO
MRKKATLDAAASKCEVPDDECPNDGQRADGLKSNGQWQNQGGEYPWRISKTVQGDVTWRGTWTLEARDRYGLSWERRKIHDGKKWKWENLPVEHWPFDHQGRWVFLTQEQEDEKVPVWKD